VGSFCVVTSEDIQEFERKTTGLKGRTPDIIRLIEPEEILNTEKQFKRVAIHCCVCI
jgi:hypothetical protein